MSSGDEDLMFPMDCGPSFSDSATDAPTRDQRRDERPPPTMPVPIIKPAESAARRYRNTCVCEKDTPMPTCKHCNKPKNTWLFPLPSLDWLNRGYFKSEKPTSGACGGEEDGACGGQEESPETPGLGICGPENQAQDDRPEAGGSSRPNIPRTRRIRDHQRRVEPVSVPNYTADVPRQQPLPLRTNEDVPAQQEGIIFHVVRPSLSQRICDRCTACRNQVERISFSPICLPFYFLLMGLPIAMSYMGFRYLQDCPMSKLIPIFLCVIGLAGVLWLIVRMFDVIRRRILPESTTHRCLPITAAVLLLAIVALLLTDIVLLRTKPNFEDKESMDYCDPTFYNFTYYANYGGLLLISIPCIIYATCLFCKYDF